MLFVFLLKASPALFPPPSATVLRGKLEIIIFEEAVHEDDELAHAGGQGHEWFLSGGA